MKLSEGVTVNSVKHLTVNDLAAKAGVSRVTIYRYLSQGKLSFQLDDSGNKIIEASEAYRWLATLGVTPVTPKATSPLLHENNSEASKLQLEVTLLRELIQAKDDIIQEQKHRLLLLEDNRQRSATSLDLKQESSTQTAPEISSTSTPKRQKKPRSLFDRLAHATGAFFD